MELPYQYCSICSYVAILRRKVKKTKPNITKSPKYHIIWINLWQNQLFPRNGFSGNKSSERGV